jgi:hypothetical protein
MTDPMTIGALVTSALATAAPEVVKSAAGETAKDAYKALKEKLWPSAAAEVATLEAAPGSKGKQLAVAEIIDARPADEQQALRALAEALLAQLKASAPAIGLDIGRLTALEAQLGNITVGSGVGVRIAEAHVENLKVGDILVGDRSGK